MKNIYSLFFWGIFICLCLSCSNDKVHNQPNIGTIDLTSSNIIELNIDSLPCQKLQTTDSCMIGTIISAIENNNRMIMFSRGIAYSFDIDSGIFINRFGIDEGASCIYNKNDIFGLFSFDKRKVSEYNEHGELIKQKDVYSNSDGVFPALICPLKDDKYISMNSFLGSEPKSPQFSILNKDFKYLETFDSLEINNGLYQNNIIVSPNNKLYYAQPFDSIIYTIDENGINEIYKVKFGSNAVPNHIVEKGFLPALDWIKVNPKFTGYITYCYSLKDYILFAVFIDGKFSLVTFNIRTNNCNAYILKESSPYELQQVLCYGKNHLYLFKSNDKELNENPTIIKLDYSIIGVK